METNHLPSEMCIELKNIGFNLPTNAFYEISLTQKNDPETNLQSGPFGWKKGEVIFTKGLFINNDKDVDFSNGDWILVSIPNNQQVFKWFENNYKIYCNVIYINPRYNFFKVEIMDDEKIIYGNESTYDNKEMCEIECIEKMINFVKSNLYKK